MLEDIEIKINRICSKAQMSSASRVKREKGWVGFLCDTGSSSDGQRVTLITEISDEDRCTVQCVNGELERTFGRLLMDAYNHGVDFNTADSVSIIEPGAIDHNYYGIITNVLE